MAALLACGDDGPSAPPVDVGTRFALTTTGLPVLDAQREGYYEAWAIDASGLSHSMGAVAPGTSTLTSPIAAVRAVEITVEPPGARDVAPSPQRLMRGALDGAAIDLTIAGAITQGNLELRCQPGTFTMFSPSNNSWEGYPSHEEAGVWLFNVRPRETPQNDTWVRLTQLGPAWTYEGWIVRDLGSASEVWLSYGKFVPDITGALSDKDDTGWGPFSGIVNFRTESVENFPGDDWISNPLGYPFPAQLTLPLNLREKNAAGQLRWTHVITVEPASDRGEAIGSERPFFLRPYRDSFGDQNAGVPRNITYRPDAVPRGLVEVR